MDKLNIAGRRTKILLRTMGQEKVVDSFIVPELEVAGLDSDMYCDMPNLFTQHKMPVDIGNISNQQDLVDWPHLKHVHLPEIKANVELLIGMNMPRALEPLEVIRSVGDGPFAIRTVLGWTVNGPLNRECCGRPGCLATVTANRVSAVTLDKLWKQQFKMDFPESSNDEQMGLSKEDLKFLELASKMVTLGDWHYSIALPLKDRDIRMPDNCAIEQRALGLKKRFIRDKDFHKDYTAFMTDLISRGYAKRVPVTELERQKWGRIKRNFVPGDVVLIVDDSAPRGSWLIGRVTGAAPDERGLVRQVWIKTPTSHVCRPITKICLLQEASDP
ncbi:uncharacterized protein LOC112431628 [Maylandia zebra]|uniref:uncharacterized protein LOC113031730 n=1 Tax=Astatotilapia calliptera TaxID=8154 RepID=UPI000E40901F|nr:uncharacterized protein LOC113031730 [Astatotilapia calliptera]XP_026039879.1 uncharacterized protein LOC113031730 [Astatotilapia calliptera]XP_026039888.1 uncharacterized protein LOC113031730 [Astatotilapia calliptera]XP_026039897.1 uncharacterized protein LOC113031730 [Astatotilapia calliptera]XP_026039906.1 uncharacterized protein LOC113031730 [Astatotilapia calliptera]